MRAFILIFTLLLGIQIHSQIIIDPGHGGKDGGTFFGNLKESTISLELANELERQLHVRGVEKTLLTRTHDEFLTLASRVEKANAQSTFFLSLHVNSHPSPRVHGFEIYSAFPRASGAATSGNPLSFLLQDLKKKGRGLLEKKWETDIASFWRKEFPGESFRVKEAPFYVLEHTTVPSLLVEVGFLSNAGDRAKFKQKDFTEKLASVLAAAVVEIWTLNQEPPTLSESIERGNEHASYRWPNGHGVENDPLHAVRR